MSLRRLPLTLALAALLALGGGALAVAQSGGDDDPPPAPRDRQDRQDRQERREVRHAMFDRVAAQLGRELGVPAERVRTGLVSVLREQRGRYDSRAERRQAKRALRDDPQAARELRDELAASLGRELDVSGARVTAAARSLLEERLDDLVQDGWLSATERTAALGCFDDPGTCARLGNRAGGIGALLGRP